jgi:Ca2+-binding EF-hand superfamily protein
MYFIELKLLGGEIPKQSDISNVEVNQEVVLPIITFEEKQQIKDIFEYADKNSQGFLESKSLYHTIFYLNITVFSSP